MSDNGLKRNASSDSEDIVPQTQKKKRTTASNRPSSNNVTPHQAFRNSIPNVGVSNKSKGSVRRAPTGDLEWYDSKAAAWKAAVYHNDIRHHLLRLADQNGTLHYAHAPEEGLDATDKTAFHADQQDWSPDRNNWPIVRGQNLLHRFERRDFEDKYGNDKPEIWSDRGRIVLDIDNHPLRWFPDLPVTLSSAFEGWRIELYMRIDHRIKRPDIHARLPWTYQKRGVSVPIIKLTAIGMRQSRFRQREGLVAWEPRERAPLVANYMKRRLNRLDPTAFTRNSTRGLPSLTRDEYKLVEGLAKSAKSQQEETSDAKAGGENEDTEPSTAHQSAQSSGQVPRSFVGANSIRPQQPSGLNSSPLNAHSPAAPRIMQGHIPSAGNPPVSNHQTRAYSTSHVPRTVYARPDLTPFKTNHQFVVDMGHTDKPQRRETYPPSRPHTNFYRQWHGNPRNHMHPARPHTMPNSPVPSVVPGRDLYLHAPTVFSAANGVRCQHVDFSITTMDRAAESSRCMEAPRRPLSPYVSRFEKTKDDTFGIATQQSRCLPNQLQENRGHADNASYGFANDASPALGEMAQDEEDDNASEVDSQGSDLLIGRSVEDGMQESATANALRTDAGQPDAGLVRPKEEDETFEVDPRTSGWLAEQVLEYDGHAQDTTDSLQGDASPPLAQKAQDEEDNDSSEGGSQGSGQLHCQPSDDQVQGDATADRVQNGASTPSAGATQPEADDDAFELESPGFDALGDELFETGGQDAAVLLGYVNDVAASFVDEEEEL